MCVTSIWLSAFIYFCIKMLQNKRERERARAWHLAEKKIENDIGRLGLSATMQTICIFNAFAKSNLFSSFGFPMDSYFLVTAVLSLQI